MSAVRQTTALISMNVVAMRARATASLVVVVGMAAVVAVALSVFSMSQGLTEIIKQTAPTPDRMAIVSAGALDGGPSNLSRQDFAAIADTPGIAKGPDGKALISGAVSAAYLTRKIPSGVEVYLGVTGVAPNILSRRPEVKIVEGRLFTPGLHEMIAGRATVGRFENIAVGNEVLLQDGPWKIVGLFQGAGTSEYGLWVDTDTLLAAVRRNSYSVVFARLEDGSKASQDAFKAALKSNPALAVDAETEQENRLRGIRNPTQFYRFLSFGVGGIMGLGALFAALNTMYAAVSARSSEIATLRAIGFSATPVMISIIAEAMTLALVGAILGAAIAWAGFNGRAQTFGNFVMERVVTPEMIGAGVAISLIVGLIGGLFPAIRAVRLQVTDALAGR